MGWFCGWIIYSVLVKIKIGGKMINIEEELIKEEGLTLHSYQDSLGNWTGGVGHLLECDQFRASW